MPASVADFAKAAEDSGILALETLAEYVQAVAPDTDATALANRLVKDGRLTAFQAMYIYGGKANSLVLGPYAGKAVVVKAGAKKSGVVSVDDLVAAKKMAGSLGGTDKAIAALQALKRFEG